MIIIESESERAGEDTTDLRRRSNRNHLLEKGSPYQRKDSTENVPTHARDTIPMRLPRRPAKH